MWSFILFIIGFIPFCVGFAYAFAILGCMFFGWDKSILHSFQGVSQ